MCVNYNPTDPVFTNKQQMLNEVFSVSRVPSENASCPIECDPGQTPINQMFITAGEVPAGQDPRFYNIGNFYIATQGQTNAVTLGELWVTYQVELFKPQLLSGSGLPNCGFAHYYSAGQYTNAKPLTDNTALYPLRVADTIGVTFRDDVSSGSNIVFPVGIAPGIYLVTIIWQGASTANAAPSISYGGPSRAAVSPITGTTHWWQQSANVSGSVSGETSIRWVYSIFYEIYAQTNTAAYLAINGDGTLPGATRTGLDIFITQIDNQNSA